MSHAIANLKSIYKHVTFLVCLRKDSDDNCHRHTKKGNIDAIIFDSAYNLKITDRKGKAYKAKLAEQAEIYDEMVEAIKAVAESGVELSVEERNILSVAFKNMIGSRRDSWKILNSIEQREETRGKHGKKLNLRETTGNKLKVNFQRYVTKLLAYWTIIF